MKVVLIGANGQLGSDLVETRPDGVELYPLKRKDVDITDREKLSEVVSNIRPDAVINTAAFHKTDDCEDDPALTFAVNSTAVRDLAGICRRSGTKLVHISTDYVFSGSKAPMKEPYTEDDVPDPVNIYGVSKYAGEILLRHNLDMHYIVRISSVYGRAGASGKGGNFVYAILKKGRDGETLRVIDDIYVSPTYTVDASKEIWDMLLQNRPYGIYHSANSGYCSPYEFAKKILEIAGFTSEIIPISHTEYVTKAKRPVWSALKSNKGVRLREWDRALEEFVKTVT